MPFRSKAQMRLFFAKEKRGELPKGTARRWAHETKSISKLPERVKKREKKASNSDSLFRDLCLEYFERRKKEAAAPFTVVNYNSYPQLWQAILQLRNQYASRFFHQSR